MLRRILFIVLILSYAVGVYGATKLDETVPNNSSTVKSMAAYQREERVKINEVLDLIGVGGWTATSTSITALPGSRHVVDTSSGGITITLPASPSVGNDVWFYDQKGTWGTGNLTLGRNGSLINGASADYVISTSSLFIVAVYTGASYGWSIGIPSVGADSHNHTVATLPAASETVVGVVELATGAETITGTDNTRAVTPSGLAGRTATDTRSGIIELATSTEVITGSDTTRAVTSAGLQAKVASETAKGIVELATTAETQTGTDATRAVTPAGMASVTATETRAGLIELATEAETQAGLDAVKAVTPASMNSRVATTTVAGLIKLATEGDAVLGIENEEALTPVSLLARTATTTRTGIVELATEAETLTGTDAERAVTPAGLKSTIDTVTAGFTAMPPADSYLGVNLLPNPAFNVCDKCTRTDQGSNLVAGSTWTGASGATPPTGWTVGDAGTFTIDAGGQSGDCLKMTLTGTAVSIYDDVSVQYSQPYYMSVYLKANDADDISVAIMNTDETITYAKATVETENTWTQVVIPFMFPDRTTTARVKITVNGTAAEYMYVDTLRLYTYKLTASTGSDWIYGWGSSGTGDITLTNSISAPLSETYMGITTTGAFELQFPESQNTRSKAQFSGRDVSFGAYLKTTASNAARICITGNSTDCSDYVSNDGEWHWTYVNKTIDADPASIIFSIAHNSATALYVNGPVLLVGGTATPTAFYSYNRNYAQVSSLESPISVYLTSGLSQGSLFSVCDGLLGPGIRSVLVDYELTCGAGGACNINLGGGARDLKCAASTVCTGTAMLSTDVVFDKDANVSDLEVYVRSVVFD